MSAYPEWPAEQIEWLEKNYQSASLTGLAKQLNELFKTERHTRASIGGKCARLGLRKIAAPTPLPKPFVPRPSVRRMPHLSAKKKAMAVYEPLVLHNSKRDCAWPDTPRCINKACIGSYCEAHARRAFREMPSDERIARLRYQ